MAAAAGVGPIQGIRNEKEYPDVPPPPYTPPLYSATAPSAPPAEGHVYSDLNEAKAAITAPLWKMALVAMVISLLVVGCVGLGYLTSRFAVQNAYMWQIGLAGFGCAALGLSAVFGLYSANEHHMCEDTPNNKADALAFTAETTFATFYGLYLALKIAERLAILECLFSMCNRRAS